MYEIYLDLQRRNLQKKEVITDCHVVVGVVIFLDFFI